MATRKKAVKKPTTKKKEVVKKKTVTKPSPFTSGVQWNAKNMEVAAEKMKDYIRSLDGVEFADLCEFMVAWYKKNKSKFAKDVA